MIHNCYYERWFDFYPHTPIVLVIQRILLGFYSKNY